MSFNQIIEDNAIGAEIKANYGIFRHTIQFNAMKLRTMAKKHENKQNSNHVLKNKVKTLVLKCNETQPTRNIFVQIFDSNP